MKSTERELEALLARIEAFLADPSRQTFDAASELYHDPLYPALMKRDPSNPTLERFRNRHIDLSIKVGLEKATRRIQDG